MPPMRNVTMTRTSTICYCRFMRQRMRILAIVVAVGVGVPALSTSASAAPRPRLSGNRHCARLERSESPCRPHGGWIGSAVFPEPETGGTAVATCTLAGDCSIVGSIERAADLTDVVLTDGSRRAYFIELDPETGFKLIYTAPLSADGLTLGDRVSLGISSEGAMAWGVPDAVLLPDGRVRIYWVEPSPQGGMATENIVSATSTDIIGTVFVRDGELAPPVGWSILRCFVRSPGTGSRSCRHLPRTWKIRNGSWWEPQMTDLRGRSIRSR